MSNGLQRRVAINEAMGQSVEERPNIRPRRYEPTNQRIAVTMKLMTRLFLLSAYVRV
jgi:hypothetical protein